ncbi:MAG TPA: rhomboid family intramembrane serine protease [Candidatus Mediterraneibacter merdipullorum]|nr:rhomboid family intramembrane serine protease [Candidatus Mediterraneibacter merdipullorum]
MKQKPEAVCTVGLIILNTAVFFILTMLGDTEDAVFMVKHGAMYDPLLTQGQEYYRLFTCLFLHFGIEHLLNNMVMLGALGWNLEPETGRWKFLVIYFASGLFGNILSFVHDIRTGQEIVSAGASGAVFGLMGALLYVVIANRGRLGRLSAKGLVFMAALSLYFGLTSSGVDNLAHIGGLAGGFLLAVLLYRKKR